MKTTAPERKCWMCGELESKHTKKAADWRTMPGCIGHYKDEGLTQHWSVTVERNGEQIVTIESNHLSGREFSVEDERVVRMAAECLRSMTGTSCGS